MTASARRAARAAHPRSLTGGAVGPDDTAALASRALHRVGRSAAGNYGGGGPTREISGGGAVLVRPRPRHHRPPCRRRLARNGPGGANSCLLDRVRRLRLVAGPP